MGFVLILLLILFVTAILASVIVLPVIGVTELVGSTEKSITVKKIWLSAIVLLPLGGMVYGLFGSTRNAYRHLSIGLALSLLVFVASTLATLNWLERQINLTTSRLETLVNDADRSQINDMELIHLRSCLQQISKELEFSATSFAHTRLAQLRQKDNLLATQLVKALDDGKLTVEEYNDWMVKFHMRALSGAGKQQRAVGIQ